MIIIENRNINYYVYNLSDFKFSDKAIWVIGRFSYPRLEPRDKNIFLPLSEIAVQVDNNRVYIPAWLADKLNSEGIKGNYKYSLPDPILRLTASQEGWNEFREIYDYRKGGKF